MRQGNDRYAQQSDWYQSDLGNLVFIAEHFELEKRLPSFFGYHLLQLGGPRDTKWLDSCPIRHQIWCAPQQALVTEKKISTGVSKHSELSGVVADFHDLPFAPSSLDVVLIPHILEFSADPALVLHEASQALIPEGYMLILGFNPMSLWGMRHLLNHFSGEVPWAGRFHRIGRIRHWLESCHCEIDEIKTFFYRPPIGDLAQRKKLRLLEALGQTCWPWLGGLYLIVARKKIATVTPIKLERKRVGLLARKGVCLDFIGGRSK